MKKTNMKHYAGSDISLKGMSVCVADQDAEIVAGCFRTWLLKLEKIMHDRGQLLIWIKQNMADIVFSAIFIDIPKAQNAYLRI